MSEESPNTVMQLTNSDAAQGVLRPPCLLSPFAADYHVRQSRPLQVAVLSEGQENKVDGVNGLWPV
jgi:hypothetical protein